MTQILLSLEKARSIVLERAFPVNPEIVPLEASLGRVLAHNVYSDRDYPPFNRAAVDGFAINSKYYNPKNTYEIAGEVLAGETWKGPEAVHKAIKVMTGAPVPEFMDSMIKVEETQISGNAVSFSTPNFKAGQNVALKGEDLLKGEVILSNGTEITWPVYAALSVIGAQTVDVAKLPSVHIISTGDEVVSVKEDVKDHQIRNSNAYSIEGFLKQYGIIPHQNILIGDSLDKLQRCFSENQPDILIISGGVSMGDADFVPSALQEAGFKKCFHKVAIKPGKPIWFGFKGRSVVFALPGNPISVQVALKIFLAPFLRKILGMSPELPLKLPLMEVRRKRSSFDEFFNVKLNREKMGLEICWSNGSGDIRATTLSSGIALHPGELKELKSGQKIDYFPW